jgi:subtilase family serine protease
MRSRARFGVRSLLVALAACAVAAAPAGAASQTQVVHVGSAAILPANTQTVAAVPATQQLQLTVALKPQDPSGLENYATEVATPGSPLYHHYLSVAQFAQSFGATPAQIATVQSALRAQGVSVGAPLANDLTLPVTGSAAQVEKAFSVSLSQVKLATGRTAFANTEAPSVPLNAAQFVQGVIGLDNVALDESQQNVPPLQTFHPPEVPSKPAGASISSPQVVTGGPQPSCPQALEHQAIIEGPSIGYTADQIATIYQFSSLYLSGDLGAGQTIALFEQQPYSPTDIATYQACYGTSVPVSNVEVDGGPGPYTPPPGGSGDDESALDIEQVVGLAPKANVLVYQGPETTNAPVDILNTIVSQDVAKVISSSYGVCEALNAPSVIKAEEAPLQEAAVQGQSFFISSGDSGSQQCAQSTQGKNRELSVLNPAGQPFATGVGGTTVFDLKEGTPHFYEAGGPTPPTEGVWSEGIQSEGGSSGGGLSKEFAMPSYQSGAAGSLGVINSGSTAVSPSPCGTTFCREVPDVSADASARTGYVVISNGQWGVAGGTSAAAPLWAAFTALANASPTCRGIPIGFANPSLYAIAGSSYLNNFHDVAAADPFNERATNNPEGTALYPVGPGYDMATGIGSPIAPALAASLCAQASPVFAVGVGNPGARTGTVGVPLSLQIAGSDSGGLPLSFSATGLPAGLSMTPTGLISGTPTTAQATTVTVTAGDSKANAGSTAFPFTVAIPIAPPTVSGVSLTGIAKRKAKLKFTVSAGGNAPAFKSIAIKLPGGLTFSHSTKTLLKGIIVKGANGKKVKIKVKVSKGILAITLAKSVRKATFTLTGPAINVSGNLASKVKHRKVKALNVAVTVTDISHRVTPLIFRTKVS